MIQYNNYIPFAIGHFGSVRILSAELLIFEVETLSSRFLELSIFPEMMKGKNLLVMVQVFESAKNCWKSCFSLLSWSSWYLRNRFNRKLQEKGLKYLPSLRFQLDDKKCQVQWSLYRHVCYILQPIILLYCLPTFIRRQFYQNKLLLMTLI